jgi:hypothetical protein
MSSSGTEGAPGTSGAVPSSSTSNAFQQMLSRNLSSAQNKEWNGEPLVASREYPKTYVESAGGTYEDYVWVIERHSGASGNIKWKWKFCATERVGQRLSIAAHITGLKFGSLSVRQCRTVPTEVKAKIIQQEEEKKKQASKRKAESVRGILESSAQAAAASVTQGPAKFVSPVKQQSEEGPRLKQLKLEPAQVIVEKLVLSLFVHKFYCLQMNRQNAALNLSIMYFLAENNISPFTTAQPAFREMIAAAQQNTSAAVAHRRSRRRRARGPRGTGRGARAGGG